MMKKQQNVNLSLLWAFLLVVLCSSIANSQENDACENRYLTVNAYKDLDAVNISCFGESGDCTVYSSAPGNGCYEDSLTLVGTVPKGKTKVITHELPYGAALCSNNQTSIQVGDDFTAIVQLPRATQSGKMFHTTFTTTLSDGSYKCSVSALGALANILYSVGDADIDTVLVVDMYQTQDITLDVESFTSEVLKIVSDVSVIVSCQETTSTKPQLMVLEPISSQPLMVVVPNQGAFQFTIANCATNEKISDLSRVTWTSSVYSGYDQKDCFFTHPTHDRDMYFLEQVCAVLVFPNDNETCVSLFAYDRFLQTVGVGLPEVKLTKQLISYPYQQIQFYFAFSPTTCSSAYGKKVDTLKLEWLPGLEDDNVAGAITASFIDKYDSVKCSNPVYIFFHGYNYVAFRSGYQSYDMWTPFFLSENCKLYPPTPPPAPPSKAMRPPFAMGSLSALLALCSYFVL